MILLQILLIALAGNFALTGSRLGLTLGALHLGAAPFTVGAMQATFAFLPLFLAVPAGRWIDRIGTRRPILASTALYVVAPLAPAISPTLAAHYFSAVLFGIAFLGYALATGNLVGRMGDASGRAARFSWMMIGTALGNALGPVTVGLVIDGVGHAAALLALVLPPAAVFVWTLRSRVLDLAGMPVDKLSARGGIAGLLADRELLATIVASTVFSVAWDTFTLTAPLYGSEIGLSASVIGLVMGLFPGSMLGIRLFLPWISRRVAEWRVLAAGLGACAIGYVLFPFANGAAALIGIAVMLGIGLGVGFPIVLSLSFAASPQGRQAEVLGVRTAATQGCHVAVPVAVGAASGAFGLAAVFWVLALFLGACGIAAERHAKRRRESSAPL